MTAAHDPQYDEAAPTLWRARRVVPRAGVVHDGGGVVVAAGCVLRVLASAGEARRAARELPVRDLGDVALTPGLVNAHVHLELGALAGQLPRGVAFEDWVGALLAARAARTEAELAAGYRVGARTLLAGGTTLVGDIDSLGSWSALPSGEGPRRRVYRELLDARDGARRAAALAGVAEPLDASDAIGDEQLFEGLSPHAPFSVGHALLDAIAGLVRERSAALAMHWAETADEVTWLDGEPAWFDRFFPREDGMAGIDALERHGLLGPSTALIHGNFPRPGERERIAAAGATLVHCPGSHAYFERAPFDWAAYADAGVALALGTDSAASNDALDMRRELALLRASQPALDPIDAWRAATAGGARALGLAERAGCLAPGAWADLVAFEGPPKAPEEVFDWLTSASPAVTGVWLGGRPAVTGSDSKAAPATSSGGRARDPGGVEG